MSKVVIRSKTGSVTALQLGLAVAILASANEVFAEKPELKATQVITPDNEITVVSKVKDGVTIEFTGREYKAANVARVAATPTPAPVMQNATEEVGQSDNAGLTEE
ncbi:hypothetical protein [Acinetobacter phage pB23]|nr:hypothetical protein [Acinetobacter phage pB23]